MASRHRSVGLLGPDAPVASPYTSVTSMPAGWLAPPFPGNSPDLAARQTSPAGVSSETEPAVGTLAVRDGGGVLWLWVVNVRLVRDEPKRPPHLALPVDSAAHWRDGGEVPLFVENRASEVEWRGWPPRRHSTAE